MVTYLSLFIPLIIECYTSLHNNDIDRLLEALPVLATNLITMIKLANLNFNQEKFRKLYDLVISEWESLKFKDEAKTLDEVTRKGGNIAFLYRTTLLGFLALFAIIPLMPLFLDIVLPLNETRLKHQVYKLNYLVDGEKYFYPIYFHSVWSSILAVTVIVTVDSMYMLVTYHACGLFTVCG
ncbi:uncharacterized protein LOC143347210 [Colletes latitarsis]|uniref:uncharacterized protein LOC143347210 n=1 Tax=Colletes latitarsis TaxID=2605962 RepID=UPI004036B6D3